jgi:hypothetical protein
MCLKALKKTMHIFEFEDFLVIITEYVKLPNVLFTLIIRKLTSIT